MIVSWAIASFYGFAVYMPAAFISFTFEWLRRLYAYGVSVETRHGTSLQWLRLSWAKARFWVSAVVARTQNFAFLQQTQLSIIHCQPSAQRS